GAQSKNRIAPLLTLQDGRLLGAHVCQTNPVIKNKPVPSMNDGFVLCAMKLGIEGSGASNRFKTNPIKLNTI
ncbi:hypothetical protein ACFQ41_10235, partial [Lacticaseibacillus suilingensis]